MKVVIIGGVAGGATAAARLRRLDEEAEIVVLERTGYVSYANCGLPYFVGGVITDRDELTLQTPEGFRRRFGIDVRVGHEALAIRPAEHRVEVRRLADGGTYTETYDKLILSPGAQIGDGAARPLQDSPGLGAAGAAVTVDEQGGSGGRRGGIQPVQGQVPCAGDVAGAVLLRRAHIQQDGARCVLPGLQALRQAGAAGKPIKYSHVYRLLSVRVLSYDERIPHRGPGLL